MPSYKENRVKRLTAELKRLTGEDYAPKRSQKASPQGIQEPVSQPSTRTKETKAKTTKAKKAKADDK